MERLQAELLARQFVHKFSILGAYLQKKYMTEHLLNNPFISNAELKEKAEKHSMELIQKYMEEGSFNDHYEVAYGILASTMPDDLNVLSAF